MRRKAINITTFLIITLFMRLGGEAQVSDVKVSDLHSVDSAKKVWYEYVENAGSIPIEGLLATFHCKGTDAADYDVVSVYDGVYAYLDKESPILPGRKIALEARNPEQCSGHVNAVIFSDGHSQGDLDYVGELYGRRQGVYKALGPIVRLLNGIATQRDNRDHAIVVLEGLVKSAQNDLSISKAERMGMINTYNKTIVDLGSPPSRNLPQVDEVMISDNVTREQAFAIVSIKMYKMWQTSLEGKLEPPPSK